MCRSGPEVDAGAIFSNSSFMFEFSTKALAAQQLNGPHISARWCLTFQKKQKNDKYVTDAELKFILLGTWTSRGKSTMWLGLITAMSGDTYLICLWFEHRISLISVDSPSPD
jgi:hypothetical protein